MPFQFLEIQSRPSRAIEALLANNVIGTPGLSMLYQHLGVSEKLSHIPKPHVVSVQRNGHIIGVCIFCERTMDGVTAFYVRYFAFQDGFRLKVLPQQRTQHKASIIRKEINELLNGKGLMPDQNKAFFHYAYVDPRNPRSARLCEEFGFVPVRTYTSRLFSRVKPKLHAAISIKEVSATDKIIQTLLASFYKDYSHISFENLNKIYYYVEEEGEIVAGVHINADAWRVLTLPGTTGKLLLNVFDKIPFLSRLLSKHFKFLAVEGVYYTMGKEQLFEQLLESLLYRYSLNTAIMVVDTDSSLYRLTKQINLGLLAKISPKVYGDVIVRYQHADEMFMNQQKSKPAYISVHDVS